MALSELTIALLLVGAILALWANRIGVPYPALLALAGAVLALIPGTPKVTLDPELALPCSWRPCWWMPPTTRIRPDLPAP